MSSADDTRFLALLVHRGQLSREQAESLVPRLRAGDELDGLLVDVLGCAGKA